MTLCNFLNTNLWLNASFIFLICITYCFKAFANLSVDGKVQHLNETLLNIFWISVPNKKVKCDYRQPPWINDNIKSSLKQRTTLTKIYYKTALRKSDHIKVLEKSPECTNKILEAKKTINLKWPLKLDILILLQKLIDQY